MVTHVLSPCRCKKGLFSKMSVNLEDSARHSCVGSCFGTCFACFCQWCRDWTVRGVRGTCCVHGGNCVVLHTFQSVVCCVVPSANGGARADKSDARARTASSRGRRLRRPNLSPLQLLLLLLLVLLLLLLGHAAAHRRRPAARRAAVAQEAAKQRAARARRLRGGAKECRRGRRSRQRS